MKAFLKYTLATIVGIFVATFLMTILMFITMSAIVASSEKQLTIAENSVLVFNTGIPIPERGSSDPFSSFDPVDFTFKPSPGVNDISRNLKKAARDANIKGVVIETGPMIHGWAKAREIREAILKFRESGKFVVSYTDYLMTQESYYIATAAEKIYLNPAAIMEFKGIGSEVMFYKNALDKIGIDVQVVRHGEFKGAVEPFLGTKLSSENRQQITRYIGSIWENTLEEISESRGIPGDVLNRYADELALTDLDYALEVGVIDGLMYRDEFTDRLRNLAGISGDNKPDLVSMAKYNNVHVPGSVRSENRIAVVYAEGTIVMGKGSATNIGGNHYASVIRKIREGGKYSAMVLRINSPGGNAMASDLIWREVMLAAGEMPVVVSMGDYAASGGYYIAAPATAIFAHPTTLTGSIGVFGLIPNAGRLLNEKAGITTEKVMTNSHADYPSLFRGMDPYETEIMQKSVDKTYSSFVSVVSRGREIPEEDVDRMGGGHVYAGIDAIENGLIDEIGGLNDAIEYAAELAGADTFMTMEFPEVEDPYTKLMKSLAGDVSASILKREMGLAYDYAREIEEIKEMTGVQARLPFFIRVR